MWLLSFVIIKSSNWKPPIVIEQQFQDLQESFLEKHYHHFDIGTEENKLIYMEIFQVRFTNIIYSICSLFCVQNKWSPTFINSEGFFTGGTAKALDSSALGTALLKSLHL